MAEVREGIYSVNAGEISRFALGRIDLAKLRLACERQENFLPFVLGPTMLRPGTQYLARAKDDLAGYLFEFKKSEESAALFVATVDGGLQIFDASTDTFVTRPAVTAGVTNGDFTSDISSWIDNSETGASIGWLAGGYLGLLGTEINYAWADQNVAVNQIGVEHALRIKIIRGDVVVKIGLGAGHGEFWDVELAEGEYSLAFVPHFSDFWIRLGARRIWQTIVDSVQIESAGRVTLSHPWATQHQGNIQYDRSEDVLFVACKGLQQRRLERRNTLDMRSWGISLYRSDDGPFRVANLGSTTMSSSGTTGAIFLTASRDFFNLRHAGALFRLTHASQSAVAVLGGPEEYTAPIRISGVGNVRAFAITISSIGTSSLMLQRSFSDPGAWEDIQAYATDGSFVFNDTLDNQIYWYRIGVKAAGYGAGDNITAKLEHSGSQTGIVRVRDFLSATVVGADVLVQLGAAGPTSDWAEGEWSDYRGWPVATALHDGRLFWQSELRDQGSVSDSFDSFDDTVVGDAAPINRTTVASDPHWMTSALRLLIGSTLQEISVRASAFDEPLTATAFTPRPCSDRGSMQLRALNVDGRVIFVGRDRHRLFSLEYDAVRADFSAHELTRLNQEIAEAGVVDIASQRQPDTRIHLVLADGRVIVLVHEPNEDVSALVPFTFSGDAVERVACLPGIEEDKVYVYVNRGGKRCLERYAMRSEGQGRLLSKSGINSHVVYQGATTSVISGLDHLEGREVVVWADNRAFVDQSAPLTVSGGVVALPGPVNNAVVGLPYDGLLKTAKLAAASQGGTSLTGEKRVGPIGLVMADVAWKGVRIGRDFNHMTALPATYRGRPLAANEVLTEWDMAPSAFNGGWGPDPRICIKVSGPYCCTIQGIVFGEQVNAGEDLPPARNG